MSGPSVQVVEGLSRALGRALHPRSVWRYMRRAPGTFIWLAILLATTAATHHLSDEAVHHLLVHRSTNLHHLADDPIRVLIASALWVDGGAWLGYLVIYNIFHVPAERWLGTLRWLVVVAIAHIGATYLSEGVLYWAIESGRAPHKAFFTLDVGVSYALAGVVGVLAYRIAKPWRYPYIVGALLVYILPMVFDRNFTDLGHLSALLIGFACYPLTLGRPGVWDPVRTLRASVEYLRSVGAAGPSGGVAHRERPAQ